MKQRLMDAALAQATTHAEAGDAAAALDAAERALQAALQRGDVAAQAEAIHCTAGIQLRLLGKFAAALDAARQAAFNFQQAEMPLGESRALATQAIAAARLGYYETAVDCALLAVRLCTAPGSGVSIEQVLAHHALGVAMFIGRCYGEASEAWQRAIQLAYECRPWADPYVLHADLSSAEVMRTFTARNGAGSDPSLESLADNLRRCEELLLDTSPLASMGVGARSNTIVTHAFSRAMLHIWRADRQSASAQLAVLRDIIGAARRPWLEALALWAESELALVNGDLPAARHHAARMIEIAVSHRHEGLADIGLSLAAHLASTAGDHAGAVQSLNLLAQREQIARASSLRGRVTDVERQLELRSRTRQLHDSEAGRAHFEQLALEDGLTGLPNRRHFELQLQGLLDEVQAHGGEAYLVMIDVDKFKQINDGHSHTVGDTVLQAIAALIRQCVRDKDFPARLAGDEFVIIMRDTGVRAARALTARLAGAVSQHAWGAVAAGLSVSVSLGVAEVVPGDTPRSVLSRSDQGMYEHKRDKSVAR
jgi:diguanylate cyclase (GGDEF)-like protein